LSKYELEGHDRPPDTRVSRQFLCEIDQKVTCDCKHDWYDKFFSLGLQVYPTFKTLNKALKDFFDVKLTSFESCEQRKCPANEGVINEDLNSSPKTMVIELNYMHEDKYLVDLKSKRIEGHDYVAFQMEIPDELNLGAFYK
jgi:hypothetical protein